MTIRFQTARFHVDSGPSSLFERAHYKMDVARILKLHSKHFNERRVERSVSQDVMIQIKHFDPAKWSLKTIEVRADTGKFVNTTWEMIHDDTRYWITIGFGNVVQTIVTKTSDGLGYPYVKSGSLYELVRTVNEKLMNDDFQNSIRQDV